MCVLSDVERMGTLSVEMAECMLERSDRKYKYTPEAMDELQKSLKVLNKMFCDSLKALQGDDGIEPGKMMKRKDKLLDLDIKMRKAHIERVNKGKCKASLTAPFKYEILYAGRKIRRWKNPRTLEDSKSVDFFNHDIRFSHHRSYTSLCHT